MVGGGQSSYGNMQAGREWASRQVGSDAYFHGDGKNTQMWIKVMGNIYAGVS